MALAYLYATTGCYTVDIPTIPGDFGVVLGSDLAHANRCFELSGITSVEDLLKESKYKILKCLVGYHATQALIESARDMLKKQPESNIADWLDQDMSNWPYVIRCLIGANLLTASDVTACSSKLLEKVLCSASTRTKVLEMAATYTRINTESPYKRTVGGALYAELKPHVKNPLETWVALYKSNIRTMEDVAMPCNYSALKSHVGWPIAQELITYGDMPQLVDVSTDCDDDDDGPPPLEEAPTTDRDDGPPPLVPYVDVSADCDGVSTITMHLDAEEWMDAKVNVMIHRQYDLGISYTLLEIQNKEKESIRYTEDELRSMNPAKKSPMCVEQEFQLDFWTRAREDDLVTLRKRSTSSMTADMRFCDELIKRIVVITNKIMRILQEMETK